MTLHTLFIGDTHLERLASLLPNLSEAEGVALQLLAIRRILELARTRGIKYVFCLGDLFHTEAPKQTTIAAFLRLCAEFSDLFIIIILGNHDYNSEGRHSQLVLQHIGRYIRGSNVRVFDRPTSITLDGVPIFLCPWPHKIAPPTPHLCIGHFDVKGFQYYNGMTITKNAVDKTKLGRHNIWVLGHNHTPQVQPHDRIINPGTPYQVNSDEHHNKKLFEAQFHFDGKQLHMKQLWRNIDPVFKLHHLMYKEPNDLQQVSEIENNFWILHHMPDAEPLPARWLVEHPQVINMIPLAKQQQQQQQAVQVDVKEVIHGFSPTYMLPEFLQEHGLPETRIPIAIDIVNKIVAGLTGGS